MLDIKKNYLYDQKNYLVAQQHKFAENYMITNSSPLFYKHSDKHIFIKTFRGIYQKSIQKILDIVHILRSAGHCAHNRP